MADHQLTNDSVENVGTLLVQATENINEAERHWIVMQNSQGTEAWQLNG